MGKDDPFGFADDTDRTVVIRPQPGGRGPAVATRTPAPPATGGLGAAFEVAPSGRSALVAAATPLLNLATLLKTASPTGQVDELRNRVLGELNSFADRAAGLGLPYETTRLAGWSLSALIDDLVLNTPWGQHSNWPQQSIVSTLFHEVDAGERFFDRLDKLKREPGRYSDLLELMYLCLALGFEGRHRVARHERPTLAERREDVYRLLAGPARDRPDLSPRWRGLKLPEISQRWRMPLWVLLTGVLAVILLTYTGFRFWLASEAAQLSAHVQSLPPRGAVTIVPAAMSAPDGGMLPPIESRLPYQVMPKIEAVLGAEIQDGIVDGEEDAATVVVRFRDLALFASSRAELTTQFTPLFERLAGVLRDEPGAIRVVGHTDNVPIGSTRFASNWELSTARAAHIRQILVDSGIDPARISVEGRADTEPVASNDTAEGRALNRRIEVLLSKGA